MLESEILEHIAKVEAKIVETDKMKRDLLYNLFMMRWTLDQLKIDRKMGTN